MKKSLIALAVAGSFAAPAFAATSNVDVYGIVSIAVEDNNDSGTKVNVVDRVSRIGFKGSEDLGGGLKAIWQIEQGLSSGSNPEGTGTSSAGSVWNGSGYSIGGGTLATRNTFVGLAGDFGTFIVGKHDTPYKLGTASLDPFADTAADYNGATPWELDIIDNIHDHRSPSAIAYISPTWSGFHFAVATVATNISPNTNVNGSDNKSFDAFSATGVYVNGPLFASLSYQDINVLDSSAWKVGVGYTFGDAKVGFIYESVDNAYGNAGMNTDAWLLNGVYNMGPIALKAEYGKKDYDNGYKGTKWVLGADYNLSKRTLAYVVYNSDDYTDSDRLGTIALGLKHSF